MRVELALFSESPKWQPKRYSNRPTLSFEALKDGKITARSSAWDENRTILANQYLELRNRDGQMHVIRCERGDSAAAMLLADERAITFMAEQLFEAAALEGHLVIDGHRAARYLVTKMLESALAG